MRRVFAEDISRLNSKLVDEKPHFFSRP